MKRILSLGTILVVAGALSAATLNAKATYGGGWGSYNISLVSSLNGYTPVTDASTDYTRTGACAYLRADSTGFYHVAKIDNRWWLIDPDGYAGINMAVTSLDATALQDDYDLLRRNGFNGTGNFIASESQTKNSNNLWNYGQMSYTRRYNFYASYRQVRHNYYTTPAAAQNNTAYLLVFDPQFEVFCQTKAKESLAQFAAERDLLGYFTDNELPFNDRQLALVASTLSAGDPTYDSTAVWAARNGIDMAEAASGNITQAQKEAYAVCLAERYYSVVTAAIRAVDPNHMILGSRLHGVPRGIQGVVDMSHRYCDVTSVNFYDTFCPNDQIARTSWTNDHPCLVTEFYIKDIHFASGVQEGAGWYVNTQDDRGRWYQNTCLQLLQNPCFIGWQYFRFMDNNNSNKGLVSPQRTEYTDMTRYTAELNSQVYRLIDFFDGTSHCPQGSLTECAFTPVADTYLTPGTKQEDTHGSELTLLVRYYGTENQRRESFLSFDLSRIDSLIPYLKKAELRLVCATTDAEPHNLLISGVEDASWDENTLCGALRAANTSWKSTYNRLASYKQSFSADSTYAFDVTPWVRDYPDKPSFKLHALTKTDNPVSFYSRESAFQPQLVLTFWGEHTLPEAIPQTSKTVPAVKIIENGQVYILRAGNKYTLFGVPLKK